MCNVSTDFSPLCFISVRKKALTPGKNEHVHLSDVRQTWRAAAIPAGQITCHNVFRTLRNHRFNKKKTGQHNQNKVIADQSLYGCPPPQSHVPARKK